MALKTPEVYLREAGGDAAKALAAMSKDLTAENAARTKAEKAVADASVIRCGVGKSGTVSVFGLQRFPVSLYQEQWLRLLDHAGAIRAFIAANRDKLKVKGQDTTDAAATGTDGE